MFQQIEGLYVDKEVSLATLKTVLNKFFDKFFDWLFARTKRNHQSKYDKLKDLFLVVLVSIPLPVTGAWTGSLCAFLFGVPFKRAFPLISLGVIIAGVIVTLISLGIITLI